MHLGLKSGVTDLLKMLTYSRVCPAFSSAAALLLRSIYNFEMGSKLLIFTKKKKKNTGNFMNKRRNKATLFSMRFHALWL